MKPLDIEGAWLFTPELHPDARGVFCESFRGDEFAADLGYRFNLAQANCSESRKGVIRGIHFADVPPGQAKFFSCVRGTVLDVIVDIRAGSPSFGCWETVRLDARDHRAVFLPEGLGHAFLSLTDSTVSYLCSAPYAPEREHGIHPLDPEIGIRWDIAEPILSARDAMAPSLSQALRDGLLPRYDECIAYAKGHQ
jgi:dTDP-4-dehydrorhamnose 3,5-epimerase